MKKLTKTIYVQGLENDAYLWRLVNNPQSFPKPTPELLDRFEDGKLVEKYAKNLYVNEEVEFEKEFNYKNLSARVDVLRKTDDGFDLIEIKSSTKVKDKYLDDLAFQKYVLKKCKVKVNKCLLVIINKEYTLNEELDLTELFLEIDLTDKVEKRPLFIQRSLEIINQAQEPEFKAEDLETCSKDNPIAQEFLSHLPKNNIFEVYKIRKSKAIELFNEGKMQIKDAPNEDLNKYGRIQKKEKEHYDKEHLKKFFSKLEEPISYLDFETYQLPIPLFEGSKPFEHIPFQYSLHFENNHKEFLFEGKGNPKKEFLEKLKKDLPNKGPILVFYKHFEAKVLRELGKAFPESKEWTENVIKRFIDLRDPFANFWYYHPSQRGSTSIKDILPVFSNESYKGMFVNNGRDAMVFYKKNKENLPEQLKKDLLEYCKLDTKAMQIILEGLKQRIV